MTQNAETEFKSSFDKTIAFLTKKSDTVCGAAAFEIAGKPENDIRKNRQKTQAL